MIRSHPTTYADVRFRSRLEARWAAFFDIAGWKWEYEPLDLRGWVPDFLLKGEDSILVEVKPIQWSRDEEACVKLMNEDADLEKVRRHVGREYSEVLVLGAYAPPGVIDSWAPMLGYLTSQEWGVEPAALYGGTGVRKFDFAGEYGSCVFRMGGDYDGRSHLRRCQIPEDGAESAWREAGNRVQWRPPGVRRDDGRIPLFS